MVLPCALRFASVSHASVRRNQAPAHGAQLFQWCTRLREIVGDVGFTSSMSCGVAKKVLREHDRIQEAKFSWLRF